MAIPPGVPPLLFPLLFPFSALVTQDAANLFGLTSSARWGIFDSSGNPVLTVDSTESVEYDRNYDISDAPQTQGSFMSYNKVQEPYKGKVGLLLSQSRQTFFQEIESRLASLDFVTLITPEVSYVNGNLVHFSYRRTARRGVSMILVNVGVQEVRPYGTATLSNTQSTNGTATTQNGTVQSQTPSTTTSTPDTPVVTEPTDQALLAAGGT